MSLTPQESTAGSTLSVPPSSIPTRAPTGRSGAKIAVSTSPLPVNGSSTANISNIANTANTGNPGNPGNSSSNANGAAPVLHSGVATFTHLTLKLEEYLSSSDLKKVKEAYRFSDEMHLGQMRKSGEPYISHPLAVAEICADWKLDAQAMMAALLAGRKAEIRRLAQALAL